MRVISFLRVIAITIIVVSFVIPSPVNIQAKDMAVKPNYVITEYKIEVMPVVKNNVCDIICEMTIKPYSDLKVLYFYMDPVWKIDQVTGINEFYQEKDLVRIPIQVKKDKTFTLRMHYFARFKGSEYPGRVWNYVSSDGMYLFQWWYPVTLYTIAAGYSEVVTLKIDGILPLNWKVASPDVVNIELSKDKANNVISINARDPAFFYHFMAGPYESLKVEDPGKVVTNAIFYGQKKNFDRGKELATEIFSELGYFESVFGTPAPKSYLIIEMPDKFKTVLAERGAIFVPSYAIPKPEKKELKPGEEPPIDLADAEFLADKVAASWWGGTVYGVGPESEFLNTSLAVYSSFMYQAKKLGDNKFVEQLRKARASYFEKIKPEKEVPLSSVVEEALLSTYFRTKGPIVYHMLRQVVGDGAFMRGLKNYAGRFAGKFATLADLDAEVSKAAGQKLTWFFEQWVNQVGRLTYSIDFTLFPGQKPWRYKIRLDNKGSIKMPFKIDIIMSDRSMTSFDWKIDEQDIEKGFSSDKEPVGARIHSPEGYMLTDDSLVNSLLKGPIRNFFYLNNFIIAEGSWQGNKDLESAAHTRAKLYQDWFKKYYNLDVPLKYDKDINTEDLKKYNLILVGCSGCNSILSYFDRNPAVLPISYVVWFAHEKTFAMVEGPEREGVYVAPNPANPWTLVLADEFFSSKDNFDTHNLATDFYMRSLKTGEVAKGDFFKTGTGFNWRTPNAPKIKLTTPKDDQVQLFENVFKLEGDANADFNITYNSANPRVFNETARKDFIPKGDLDKSIWLLRGKEFQDTTLMIESKQMGITYQRLLHFDFRGELEPPKVKIKTSTASFKFGTDVVIDWEASDNETYETDIQFCWSIDNGQKTSWIKGKRTILKGLKIGKHTFRLFALDNRGNLNYATPNMGFEVKK